MDKKRGGQRPGAGSKKKHPLMLKTARNIKLPEWLWQAIDARGSRPSVIEPAVMKMYKLAPPKIEKPK